MVANGTFLYMDQPYCVVNKVTDEWSCTVTATKNHEGGSGEGVYSLVSPDGGSTWLDPVPLEPENVKPGGLANSYSTVAASEPNPATGRQPHCSKTRMHRVSD